MPGGHRDAVAPDLADGLGGALEPFGVMVHDPLAAVPAAGLLVGEEGERRRARRLGPRAREVADTGQDHRVHVLHVHRPTTPEAPVAFLGGERVHLPVSGIRGDDVGVAVHDQTGPGRVGALEPHHHRCPPRVAFDEHRV